MATDYAKRLRSMAQGAMTRDRRIGQQAEDEFLERSLGFDADEAARTTARGLFDEFEETTGRGIRDLRASLAGTGGRLMSGYGQEQEDEFVGAARRNLNQQLSRLALQTAGLNLENIGQIGAFGERTSTRFLDMLAGERDRELLEEQMRQQRRSSLFGGLARLAGTVAGSLIGGPAGGAAAAWASGKLAGATK